MHPILSKTGNVISSLKRLDTKLKLPLAKESLLVRWANKMRAYYGFPIYLVGSQLDPKIKFPGDIDVICFVPDEIFFNRFFLTYNMWLEEMQSGIFSEEFWQWSERCVKDSIHGMKYTVSKIDFKVYPLSFKQKNPRILQLDTREITFLARKG